MRFKMRWTQPEIQLKCPTDRLLARIGRAVASKVRESIKKGRSIDGHEVPWRTRTGGLNRSIQYRRRRQGSRYIGVITPSTSPTSKVSKRARSYYGLMRIHSVGQYRRKEERDKAPNQGRSSLYPGHTDNPLAVDTDELEALIQREADKVMSAAFSNGEFALR